MQHLFTIERIKRGSARGAWAAQAGLDTMANEGAKKNVIKNAKWLRNHLFIILGMNVSPLHPQPGAGALQLATRCPRLLAGGVCCVPRALPLGILLELAHGPRRVQVLYDSTVQYSMV